ncbi:hypothetical protein PG993_014451 [Apiospora rasikravindrae]|uniref:Mitochondrial pyruvate carrier n=1 Tax=Apiospora rasikravindrae TaxID=990691 RepID=A0ABR1RMY8_9PEZI
MSATTTTLFRAARPVIFQQAATRTAFTTGRANAFRNFSQKAGRRYQSTAAGETAQVGWFSRMWNSPVGFKTVHFWAPVMKWALVIAGISDFARPAEKLSLTQNAALTSTGLIWTRWCTIITPKNYLLAAVNGFLAIVGIVQCSRIGMYYQSQKNKPSTADELKEEAKEKVEKVKDAVKS